LLKRALISLIHFDERARVDSLELSYRTVTGDVYHIDPDCPHGRMIPAEWRLAGTGELRLCGTCRARTEARRESSGCHEKRD